MSGSIFRDKETAMALFNIFNIIYDFFKPVSNQYLWRILTVVTVVYHASRDHFHVKAVFYFWRQIQIPTEISQNYTHICGQGSNFETSGGRMHPPDSLDLSTTSKKTFADISWPVLIKVGFLLRVVMGRLPAILPYLAIEAITVIILFKILNVT